jgi:hypothetical protein
MGKKGERQKNRPADLSEKHLREIDARANDDIKPNEKPLKVNMSMNDLAKLITRTQKIKV